MALKSPEDEMLQTLATPRKVVVKVTNNSRFTLCNPRVFMKTGVSNPIINLPIKPSSSTLYGFRKMITSIKGCHGVLGLQFEGTDEYIVLLFRNPFVYMYKKFALSIENNPGVCDIDLRKLKELSRRDETADGRFASSHAGSNCVVVRSSTFGIQVKAAMSASHESVVYVTVTDDGTSKAVKEIGNSVRCLVGNFENSNLDN